jgi:hypothetical protein
VYKAEELHNFHASPTIIRVMKSRMMRWTGYVSCTGGIRNAYRILVGKPKGKRPPIRLRHKGENNITMDLKEIGWEDVD